MLRLVLALSIITWILGGIGAWWFAIGALSPRRLVSSGFFIASVAIIAAFVTDPVLELTLIALTLIGYAAVISTKIQRAVQS